MKLVIRFNSGDGYTYSCDTNVPFEYESVEHAELDFLTAWEKSVADKTGIFWFCNEEFYASDFGYYDEKQGKEVFFAPTILPLEQWFEEYKMG